MKRILFICLAIACLIGSSFGAMTYTITGRPNADWWTGQTPNKDPAWAWAKEVESRLEYVTATGAFYFDPTDTAPAANEGMLYYSNADNALKLRTDLAWVDVDISGSSSLATAYTAGSKILAAASAVEIEVASGSNNGALILDSDDTTPAIDVLSITSDGADAAAVCIQIEGTAGFDIQGTSDVWNVSYLGVASCTSVNAHSNLTFTEPVTNDVSLLADGDGILTITASGMEDIDLNFATANTLTLTTSTSLDKVNWGNIDEHSGLLSLTFDPDVAGLITIAGTGNTDDISITQTGTVDVSVALVSAGSVADAIHIESSDVAGGILLDSGYILDIDVVGDITIDTTDGAYTLTIAGSSAGDYIMTAADTASLISVDDFHVGSTAGSITIEAEEDAADAILITADGSTASTLRLFNDTGTSVTEGAAAIQLLADVGGICLESNVNLASAIQLVADGGTSSSIFVQADTGTGDESIHLLSDVGGIKLEAASGSIDLVASGVNDGDLGFGVGDDFTATVTGTAFINATEDVKLTSSKNAGSAILLTEDGGTSGTIKIHADTGSVATSIELLSDVGGITLNAASGSIDIVATGTNDGDLTLTAGDIMSLTHVDVLRFEGAVTEIWEIEGTANGSETKISFTDPTADITWTFPDGGTDILAVMGSVHTTNYPEVASSVTGGINQLIFEGTVDTYEAVISAVDVTGDTIATIPDGGEGMLLIPTYLAYTATGNIDADECWGGVLTNTGTSCPISLNLPTAVAGMRVTVVLTVGTDIDLNAYAGDTILLLTDTAADAITSAGAIGNSITLHAVDGNSWLPIVVSGVWTDID